MVATAHGDYFRLLNPSKTYTVSASAEGYERSVQKVYVPNNNEEAEAGASPLELFSAKILNFTLNVDKSKAWSKSNDFGIDENLASSYLTNDQVSVFSFSCQNTRYSSRFSHLTIFLNFFFQMRAAMANLENDHPDLGVDHAISTGRRMTNLLSNFECLF